MYFLEPINDPHKSFYKKAKVVSVADSIILLSFDTPVCEIMNGQVDLKKDWDYSQTTLRHVKEFLKQNGFTADSKKQIEQDYIHDRPIGHKQSERT